MMARGAYKLRCMPTREGEWTYITSSNRAELDGLRGGFTCVEPSAGNHGPVRVSNRHHFEYADGVPYYPFGTTCYAWAHQGEELEAQTLKTLAEKPFNKLRMCVFPKHYPFNRNEPQLYPFARDDQGEHDFTRFEPAFFAHFERLLGAACRRWASRRTLSSGILTIAGVTRIWTKPATIVTCAISSRGSAAFRNLWWSLANEYDFMLAQKPMARWDSFFRILQEEDPYGRLRSIHNGDPQKNYDHSKAAVTHVCIQNWDVKRAVEWRQAYGKPVINDELEYEGDIPFPWGNISADEEVHRFWIMVVNGWLCRAWRDL